MVTPAISEATTVTFVAVSLAIFAVRDLSEE